MTDESKVVNGASKLDKILIRILIALVLGSGAWDLKSSSDMTARLDVLTERVQTLNIRFDRIENLSGRVTSIEASRFTSEQGMQLWAEIATIKARMETMSPATERGLDKLEERIRTLEQKIEK